MVHPYTVLMFHPSYASSEPAHPLETYLSYENRSFESDQMARILQERNVNLVQLLLGSLQAAEQEEMEYAQLIYEAVRYFKLFTSDQNQKSKESFIQKDLNVRRSSKYGFNWVTGGLLGYVEAVVDGKMVNMVYGKGELVKFTNKLVLVDTVTTNQMNQFAFGDYLTDMLILSKKLYAAVQIL